MRTILGKKALVTGAASGIGEAVAIGMVTAARLSESRGLCEHGTANRIAALLERFALPVNIPGHLTVEALAGALARPDLDSVRFVLISKSGGTPETVSQALAALAANALSAPAPLGIFRRFLVEHRVCLTLSIEPIDVRTDFLKVFA